MKATQSVINARKRHHEALEQLARSLAPGKWYSGLSLWRKLNRIEQRARRAAEDYCNGTIGEAGMDKMTEECTDAVKRVFGTLPPHFHINRDPRGYALKLLSNDNGTETATPFALETDWGRNQILAPTIE